MDVSSISNTFIFMASQKIGVVKNMNWFLKRLFMIVYLALAVYVAYQIIRAIFGGTWSSENVLIASSGVILTGLFVVLGFLINQSFVLGRLDERTKNMDERICVLDNRVSKLDDKVSRLDDRMHNFELQICGLKRS